MGESDARVAGNLSVTGLPANCVTISWICRRPEAPIGSPLAMQPPSVLIGIRPPISVSPGRDQLLLFAVLTESALGHVHDLGAALGVLELRDVDISRDRGRPARMRRGGGRC